MKNKENNSINLYYYYSYLLYFNWGITNTRWRDSKKWNSQRIPIHISTNTMLTNNMRGHHCFHQMTNLLWSSSVWLNLSWSFETINVCYDVIELIVFERDDYIKQIEIDEERNKRQNNWSWKIIITQEWGMKHELKQRELFQRRREWIFINELVCLKLMSKWKQTVMKWNWIVLCWSLFHKKKHQLQWI